MNSSSERRTSSTRRKRARRILAVLAWLLLLGGISYWLCLPDLEEISQSLRTIREDPNLTPQEKFEKSREIFSKLTPGQGQQVFQNDMRKRHHEMNAEMQKFLKMSPEEQAAYMKERNAEQTQFGPRGFFGNKVVPPGGGGAGIVTLGAAKAGSGGGAVFIGPAGAKPSGGPGNTNQKQKTMLDNFSPETRAGMDYQKGFSK
jgi:hypothetical protein